MKKSLMVYACCTALVISTVPATCRAVDMRLENKFTAGESTADHGKFEQLDHPFSSGPEVTRACLSCHTEAASQIHKTVHWTWEADGGLQTGLGKQKVINNFCIATPSNWCRCTSCHIGYGWQDSRFDFSSEENVDFLACHDGTGTYKKFPTGCGHPAYAEKSFGGKVFSPPDLQKIAKNIAKPNRRTCGSCHFFGGGGNGVKHGDLDSSLLDPAEELDVHMATDGLNYSCQKCHTSQEHRIEGRIYSQAARISHTIALPDDDGRRIGCENCHGAQPHTRKAKLNDHTERVACQTCHIPAYARGGIPTKTRWDWSTAGRLKDDGTPVVEKMDSGLIRYHGKKGTMRWGENLTPDYAWYNGSMSYLLPKDTINPDSVVFINKPAGDADSADARIFPFKIHRGRQPYDPVNKRLVVPKLFGPKGSGAFWQEYDWALAAEHGMRAVGLPFSGKIAFTETAMYWPITHMVAPKEKALACGDCHDRNGRLAGLGGFYLTGRDRSGVIDMPGWAAVWISIAGVSVHGFLRIASRGRRKR